jgi:hypothetical protein
MMLVATEESNQTSEDSGSERRRGLRIHQNRPIKVFEHSSARYLGGQTEDISATGLRIELPVSAPIVPGKILSIHVGLSVSGQSLANRRQMIPARVVWMKRSSESSPKMIAGVEFLASIAAHLDAA